MNRVSEFSLQLEKDIIADEQIRRLIQEDLTFDQELYAALCNVIWYSDDSTEYTASWRWAGGFIAEIKGLGGDYLDYYCSGGEGNVTPRVEAELKRIGWAWKHYEKDEI